MKTMGRIRLNRATGCWIDLFDVAHFQGNVCRLNGPAEFPALRVRERDWGEHVHSLRVGPTAYVQCYQQGHFDDTVLWLLPSQLLTTLEALDATTPVDSMRVFDRPPFAYEPGYSAYMLWAASHLARMKE